MAEKFMTCTSLDLKNKIIKLDAFLFFLLIFLFTEFFSLTIL